MKVTFKFKNGQIARDKVSQLEGVINMQTITHTGTIQYSIQPVSDDKKGMPEGWFVDEQSIELIDTLDANAGREIVDFKFDTGSEVVDQITEYSGIIIRAIYYYNNCISYMVRGKVDSKGKIPEDVSFDEDFLTLKEPREKTKKKQKKERTGGASIRNSSLRKSTSFNRTPSSL